MVAFLDLPTEVLQIIIHLSLPYDFERLALSSRRLYRLSGAFIARHNTLRRQFRDFQYNTWPLGPPYLDVGTAWDLIVCVAADPIIAHYIIRADFREDSFSSWKRTWPPSRDISDSAVPIELIRASPFIQPDSLDAEVLITTIAKDLSHRKALGRYSQAAATFVLSLLPNVESVTLPDRWRVVVRNEDGEAKEAEIERFLETVTSQRGTSDVGTALALSKCSELAFSGGMPSPGSQDIDRAAAPFLVLPLVRSLWVRGCEGRETLEERFRRHASKLVVLTLEDCHYFNLEHLSGTLGWLTELKEFQYSHSDKMIGSPVRWKAFETIERIGSTVGPCLERLSISAGYHTGSIMFNDISMDPFQRLRRLELGLELVARTQIERKRSESSFLHQETKARGESLLDLRHTLLTVLVPRSVAELSLLARQSNRFWSRKKVCEMFAETLTSMFNGFASDEDRSLPMLKVVALDCAADADDLFKSSCEKVRVELEKTNVQLQIRVPRHFQVQHLDWTKVWYDE